MQVRYQLRQRPVRRDPTTGPNSPRPWSDGKKVPHGRTIDPVTQSTGTTTSPLPELAEHLRRVAEDGYTVLPNAIEPQLVDEIGEALLRLERDLGSVPADNLFEGVHTTRVYNLLVHGPTFQKIPVHHNVLPVVEGVLDPGLLISSLSSIAIGPGEQAQPIHADDQLIPLARPHNPIICNTMWAITDFTEENGATRVIPGSHLRDEPPNPLELYDSIPAEMAKGSVLVWVGSLWHGGGANNTDQRRVGIAMNYCAGYIRQQENQQLGVPPLAGQDLPPSPTGIDRLLGLQRSCRSHRQEASCQGGPRRERGCRDGLGPPQGLRAPSGRLGEDGRCDGPPIVAGIDGDHPLRQPPHVVLLRPLLVPEDLLVVQLGEIDVRQLHVALCQRVDHLERGDGVRRRVVRVADVDAVVRTEVDESPPALAVRVEVAVDHDGIEQWPAPAALEKSSAPQLPGLHLQDGQVVIELHTRQRHAARPGRDDGVGHQTDRLGQRHAFVAGTLGGDAVDKRRVSGDLASRVDEARPAPEHDTPDHVHESVRDRHVGEAVYSRGLEVEPEHLTRGPCTHGVEHGSRV